MTNVRIQLEQTDSVFAESLSFSVYETSSTNGRFGGKYLLDFNDNDTTVTVWFLACYRRWFHNYIF